MVKCFVPNCNTGTPLCTERRTLFSTPLDEERRAEWARVIGRCDKLLTRSDKVCERHFEPHFVLRTWTRQYKGRVFQGERKPCLSNDAVPTIFEPSPPPAKEPAERPTKIARKVVGDGRLKKCCAVRPAAKRRRRGKQPNSSDRAFTKSAATKVNDSTRVSSREVAAGSVESTTVDECDDWEPTMTTIPHKVYVVRKKPSRQVVGNGGVLPTNAPAYSRGPGNDAHCLPSDATLCENLSSVSAVADDQQLHTETRVTESLVVRSGTSLSHSTGVGSSSGNAQTYPGTTTELKSTNTDRAAAIMLTPFDELFSAAKHLSLPSSSWAVHCIEENGVRDIVASEIVVEHKPPAIAVRTCKTVHVKSDMSVAILLMGKPVQTISGISTELSSASDLEQLLNALDSVRICKGGPEHKEYASIEPTCAYIDSFKCWRHNQCPIVLTSPGVSCKQCCALRETFQCHMSSVLDGKGAGTPLKCIGEPQTGIGMWKELLHNAVGSLRETNSRLKTQLQALRGELTQVKLDINLEPEEEIKQEINTDESSTSEDCEEEEGSVAQLYVVY